MRILLKVGPRPMTGGPIMIFHCFLSSGKSTHMHRSWAYFVHQKNYFSLKWMQPSLIFNFLFHPKPNWNNNIINIDHLGLGTKFIILKSLQSYRSCHLHNKTTKWLIDYNTYNSQIMAILLFFLLYFYLPHQLH